METSVMNRRQLQFVSNSCQVMLTWPDDYRENINRTIINVAVS